MKLFSHQKRIVAGLSVAAIFFVSLIIVGLIGESWRLTPITVWGVFDGRDVHDETFRAFRREYKGRVTYVKKEVDNYEAELINALAAGTGPDVFMFDNAWLAEHKDKLTPAPPALFTSDKINRLYPQVVYDDFVSGGYVWGVPLSVDTLALFYNKDILDQSGVPIPPKTWDEFLAAVPKIVKIDEFGVVQRSAIAMGTTRNINRPTDILAALMMHAGSPIVDRAEKRTVFERPGDDRYAVSPGEKALQFFLQFSDRSQPVYSWDDRYHYSIDAFGEGTLGMMFNYAYQIPTVRAKGPFVDFTVTYLPQPAGAVDRIDYAKYWGYVVAKSSRNPEKAWQLVAFMTSPENAKRYMQITGKPPALRQLIEENLYVPVMGVFARQALSARSWLQADTGEAEAIFSGMVEAARRGELTPFEAVRRAAGQMNLSLEKLRLR